MTRPRSSACNPTCLYLNINEKITTEMRISETANNTPMTFLTFEVAYRPRDWFSQMGHIQCSLVMGARVFRHSVFFSFVFKSMMRRNFLKVPPQGCPLTIIRMCRRGKMMFRQVKMSASRGSNELFKTSNI